MATLGSLVISLEANIAKFESAMTKAEYAAKKASDNIMGAFKVAGAALGTYFSISALDKTFNSITSMESQLVKTASRLNTTAETLSSFGIMARKSGMDSDAFTTTLTRLEKGLSAAALGAETTSGKFDEEGEEILKTSKTYDELGLKADKLAKLPLDQQLMAIAEGFRRNIDPSDRVRIAMELGGKSAAGLVNVFKEGAPAMEAMINRQKELGVITDEMAKKGAAAKGAASELSDAWSNFARELVNAVAPAITWVTQRLTDLLIAARKAPSAMATAAESAFSDVATAENIANQAQQRRITIPTKLPEDVFKPSTRAKPEATGGGKGGGSKDTGLDRMQSIIDTLQKDLSRLTEGSLAEIEAWAAKTINEIEKVGKKGADTETAMTMVAQVEAAKKKKATEDYELFVAKESGNTYAEIEAEAKAWSDKYKGFADAEANIAAIKSRKIWEEDVKNYENRLNRQKSALDSLAQEMPLLSQQLAIKSKILPIEAELSRWALERMISENRIAQAEADELRGLQALTNQAKKYALEREKWQNLGIGGGLRLGAEDLKKQADTWAADQTAALMKSMPQQVSTSMVTFFVDTLNGKQTDFMAMGATMAESMIQKLLEGIMVQILPALAEGLSGILGGLGGGGGIFGDIPIIGGLIEGIGGLFGFHEGGMITAHNGWPLRSDERIIKAQVGERVLSRKQNAAYEAGISGGGHTFNISINGFGELDSVVKTKVIPAIQKAIGTRGQKIGSGRY